MKKIAFLVLALVVVIPSASSLADGKFYWRREEVPPRIPYQRALLLFDGNRETLILQSKYELPDAKTSDTFGWVVPVPAVPDLASMDALEAHRLFRDLSGRSHPDVTQISSLLTDALVLLFFLGLTVVLLLCFLSFRVQRLRFIRRHRRRILLYTLFSLFAASCVLISIPNFLEAQTRGVDIIRAETVGSYDVRVVRSEKAEALIQWLQENRFHFDDSDTQVIQDYLRRGWCFTVAKINPSNTDGGSSDVVWEGLVAPLILRFPAKAPVYPLALTSTAGQKTQILLYLASKTKMKTDGRLRLHFAGETGSTTLERLGAKADPPGFFSVEPWSFFPEADLNLPVLCKFKGTLTSDQMRSDLILENAPDNQPYREHEFRW